MVPVSKLSVLVVVAMLSFAPSGALAHQGSTHGAVPSGAEQTVTTPSPAQRYFTDVTLVNQFGEEMRLYSDLLKGKIVVVSSFFTSCQASCPVVNAKIAALQSELGERLGSDVHLISITIDPVNDTPDKIAAYAQRFKARRGWYFLSGDEGDIDFANHKLGQYVTSPDAHRDIIVIGNEPTGLWKKVLAKAPVGDIWRILESVLKDR